MKQPFIVIEVWESLVTGRRYETETQIHDGFPAADQYRKGVIGQYAHSLEFITAYLLPVWGTAGTIDLTPGGKWTGK